MNSKKKRLAVAYLVSFLVNGLFWLAYARELRQASASTPKTKPETTARLKPFVLGKFVPLPPLPKKDKPPAPLEVKNPKETKDQAKEANADGKRELANRPKSETADGRKDPAASAGGDATQNVMGQGQSQGASLAGAPQSGAASQAAPQPGRVARAGGTPRQAGQKSAEGGHAATLANAQVDKTGLNGARMASAQTQAPSPSSREDQSQNDSASDQAAPSSVSAQALAAAQAAKQALALKSNVTGKKEGDNKEGQDSKAPEPTSAKKDEQKPPPPGKKVVLKLIKTWTPKPGTKFNLAPNLDLELPPHMKLVPGAPLTPEQMAQVMEMLRHTRLKHIHIDKKQLADLVYARKIAQNGLPKKPEKPTDAGRNRVAKQDPHAPHVPKPHDRVAHKPTTPKLAMARPKSPFTYKQWNSDMYRRWQPTEAVDVQDTPPVTPPLADPDAPTGLNPLSAPANGSDPAPDRPAAPATMPRGNKANATTGANARMGQPKPSPLNTAPQNGTAAQNGLPAHRQSTAHDRTKGNPLPVAPDPIKPTPGATRQPARTPNPASPPRRPVRPRTRRPQAIRASPVLPRIPRMVLRRMEIQLSRVNPVTLRPVMGPCRPRTALRPSPVRLPIPPMVLRRTGTPVSPVLRRIRAALSLVSPVPPTTATPATRRPDSPALQ